MSLKVITIKNVQFVTIAFLIMELNFKDSLSNGYHDLAMLCFNISDIAITTIKGVDH